MTRPRKRVVAYGVAGLTNSGRGIFGGYPGGPSVIVLREGTKIAQWLNRGRYPRELSETGGKARLLPYCDFDLREGDILYMCQANGGGYGDPLERDSAMVARDVGNGAVSKEVARAIYGVVLDRRGGLNAGATERLRREMRRGRLKGGLSGKEKIGGSGNGASYPPSEVVEVGEGGGRKVVRCARCKGELEEFGRDWREGCRVKELKPTEAGPLMKELVGTFVLQQFYCPSCGALLESVLMEKNKGRGAPKSALRTGLGRAIPKSASKKAG